MPHRGTCIRHALVVNRFLCRRRGESGHHATAICVPLCVAASSRRRKSFAAGSDFGSEAQARDWHEARRPVARPRSESLGH